MRKSICSDEVDAVHLLNRMLRRGLMHHHSLNGLMENSPTAYYRFPQDHFKVRRARATNPCRRPLRGGSLGPDAPDALPVEALGDGGLVAAVAVRSAS